MLKISLPSRIILSEWLFKKASDWRCPHPEGNLLFVDQNAFASPKVYVDSSVSAKEYSKQVLDYLKI